MKLAYLRSPSRPDAFVAFLSSLGLSRPDIDGLVAAGTPPPRPGPATPRHRDAMIHLRRRVLPLLLQSPSRVPACHMSPLFSPHRLLSGTPSTAPIPFAVEDYLIAACGLTPAQALKASKYLSHLKDPSNPDAVLAFLSNLGLSRADIATVVAKDPKFLCADVEKTLAPRVVELSHIGLSRPEILRFVLVAQPQFRKCMLSRNLEFWLSVFGSIEDLLQVLKVNSGLLSVDIEKAAKPNLALLQRCGISISDVPDRFMSRMVNRSTKHLQEALARVLEFGIEQKSSMFLYALSTFAILSPEKLTKNIQLFEKLGWSRDDISLAASRAPQILRLSEQRVRRSLEFLMGDLGLEIPFIARNTSLMLYSTEGRLLPRHYLMSFLKVKGLLNTTFSFYPIALMSEEKFLNSFVHPYEESVPGLAAAFAASCAGKHQWERLYEMTAGETKS